ncbi:hypothetical protein HOE04_03100 [archaeon]|jgi:hypothetical protein|nr:hypothetical protein [archaeon]
MDNITVSHSVIQGGDTITIWANTTSHGVNDSDADTLQLFCDDTIAPTFVNSDCTGGITSDGSYPYALTCTFVVPSDDVAHVEYCRVYDGIAYSNVSNVTYTTDSTSPSLSIVSVAGDSVVSYYDSVDDSVSVINVSGEESMSCRWSSSDLSYSAMSNACSTNGIYTACNVNDVVSQGYTTRYVSCQDNYTNGNNATNNLNVNFYLDYTAPTTSDDSSSTIIAPNYVVTLNEGDNVDSDVITLYCTDTTNTCAPSLSIDDGGTVTFTSANRGVNYLRYNSTDDAGNQQITVSKTININELPVFSSASDDAVIIAGEAEVNVSTISSDSDGSQTLTLWVCDSTSVTSSGCGGGHYCNTSVSSGVNLSCNFSSESDSALHNWYAFIYDALGEIAVANFSGSYTTDSDGPEITIVNPANDTFTNDDITAQIVLNEGGSLAWYELDGNGTNVTMSNSSTTSWNINIYNLSLGNHNLTFWANDSYGNVGVSAMRYFEIALPLDTTPPAITILSPVNGSYQTASGVYINISADEVLKGAWYELNYNGTKIGLSNYTSSNWYVDISLSEESEYNLTIWANDSSDNENTKNISFYVDSLAPRYSSVSALPSIANVSQDVNCSINWIDGFNLSSVKISENSSGTFENHTIGSLELGGSASYNIVGNKLNGVGSYECRFYAVDSAGNFNSTSVSFSVNDVTVPVITVTSPSNATYNQNYLDVSLIVSENSSWAGYSLNGASNVTMENTSMTNWNRTLTGLSNGGYNIIFYANDSSGNMANSSLIHFAINTGAADTTAPVITIDTISNASYKTATSVVVNVTTNENADWVGYKLNSGSLTDMSNLTSAIKWNVTLTGLVVESSNDLEVYANDSADNDGSKNITFYVDSVAPRITNISASPSPANESQNVVCNAYVNDTFSLSSVKIEENASNSGTFENHTLDLSASGWMNYTILNVEKGANYTCRFYAIDAAGNVNNSELITFVVNDVTAPVITINSPLNQNYSTDNILLSVSLSEDAVVDVNYTIDGGVTNVSLSGSGSSWSDSVIFADGSKTVTFYASDSSWNNASNSVTFNVDTSVNDVTAPAITVWSPLNNSYDIDGTVLLNISTNEDLSWAGYSNNSADLIDLDNVSTTYWNASVVFDEGQHNLTFYANDSSSNKNQGSKGFVLYVDLTNPDVEGFSCGDVNDSLDVVCSANVSDEIGLSYAVVGYNFTGSWQNSSQISLSSVSSSLNYVIASGNSSPGVFGAEIYLFDLSGRQNLTVSDLVTISDDTLPLFSNISYVPNVTDDLDPGVLVNVSVAVNEDYNISSVELMYKNSSSADWSSIVMSNGSALTYLVASNVTYNASFVVQNETWYFQINATDSEENSAFSSNYTLLVDDDISQNISTTIPLTKSITYAQRTSNNSLGYLIMNNTGDSSLNFNITLNSSDSGVLSRLSVNYSRNQTANFSAGSLSDVNITIDVNTTDLSAGLYDYNISVASESGTEVFARGLNIQTAAGPLLSTLITTYSSNVTKGENDVELVATVTNLGTADASNVLLNWTLPSDLSLASGSLSRNLGTLGVGISGTNTVTINVASSAGDANVNISADATSSNADSSSISKIITIGSPSVVTTTVGGTVSSGGGGGGSVGDEGGVSQSYVKTVEIIRGGEDIFTIDVYNKYPNSTLNDVTLSLSGYDEHYFEFSPQKISGIKYNETKSFKVKLTAPSYKSYEENILKAMINGDLIQNGASRTYSETQNIRLLIQEVSLEKIIISLDEAEKAIQKMKEAGFNVDEVERFLEEARIKLKDNRNKQAWDLSENIIEINNLAFEVDTLINNVFAVLSNPRKKSVLTQGTGFKGSGFSVKEFFLDSPALEMVNLARVAFERGDYELAKKRADSARSLLLFSMKGNFGLFLYLYWYFVLGFIIIFSASSLVGYRKYKKSSITQRIGQFDNEENNIRKLVLNSQRRYFAGKISEGDYHATINQHRKRLANIKKFRINLRNKRIKMLKPRDIIKDLEEEKTQVEEGIKQQQILFYKENKISENEYKLQFKIFNERLAEIEGERTTLELLRETSKTNNKNVLLKENKVKLKRNIVKAEKKIKTRGSYVDIFNKVKYGFFGLFVNPVKYVKKNLERKRFRKENENKLKVDKILNGDSKSEKSLQEKSKNSENLKLIVDKGKKAVSSLNLFRYVREDRDRRMFNVEKENKLKIDALLNNRKTEVEIEDDLRKKQVLKDKGVKESLKFQARERRNAKFRTIKNNLALKSERIVRGIGKGIRKLNPFKYKKARFNIFNYYAGYKERMRLKEEARVRKELNKLFEEKWKR